ncbi:unnamed protein product [Allacma fusca]|uniref:Peptidase S1 domain-containing protein n=1 Tax=Allacma fusca TaxID=39272 RepID=A0A8J2JV81_9HEXA|nr:unnamed protein product [Allacma fusca]
MVHFGRNVSFIAVVLACVALKATSNPVGHVQVVGGTLAKQGQFPHIAALLRREISGARTFFCGGSLIAPTWVLTTADCLRTHNVGSTSVRTGELDFDQATEYEQLVNAKRFVVHPDYVPTTALNNIALVELSQPVVEIPGFVNSIKLATTRDVLYPGTECTVAGWGSTSEGGATSKKLQFAYLPSMSDVECGADWPERFDSPSQLCAGFSQGGISACGVDYGGPLTCGNNPVLQGVVSYNNGCGRPGLPSVYNRVSNYVDWINSNINNSTLGSTV